MMGSAYIGTSGWNYDTWKHDFYRGVPKRAWLEHAADMFTGLEINGSFYRLQHESTLRDWSERTPESFRFTMKGHRYITHTKRLADADDTVPRSRQAALALGDKLAAVVWQLPANFHKDLPRLEAFANALERWPETRHALELRHASWFDDEVASLLERAGLAVCMSDAPDWPMWEAVTSDLVYVRLHGHTRKYASSYSRPHLERWAERTRAWLEEGRDVHIYFDNDAEGAAPKNAQTLLQMLR